jgi:hypothetical protein
MYTSISDDDTNFRACLPGAFLLLASMAGVTPVKAA